MKNEMIDVLIPAYNAEKYIKNCLDCLVNQTYKNLKIIVVDDGSKDGTLKILNEYAKIYKNIEIHQKENESNISKTRNFLLSKITSKYFSFFDADDYAEPNYFEELYHNLVSYNADASFCALDRHIEHSPANFQKYNRKINNLLFMNQEDCLAEMLSSKLFNGTVYAKLFKTETIKNADFDTKIHYGEDLDFCFKITQNLNKIIYTPKKLYHYIIRKNSIVMSKFNEKKLTCIDCYDNIINQLKNEQLLTCAKSMQGLIAIELLFYTWRDKYKNKETKRKLKNIIKHSIPHIKRNKRLRKIYRCAPYAWWLTKIM